MTEKEIQKHFFPKPKIEHQDVIGAIWSGVDETLQIEARAVFLLFGAEHVSLRTNKTRRSVRVEMRSKSFQRREEVKALAYKQTDMVVNAMHTLFGTTKPFSK